MTTTVTIEVSPEVKAELSQLARDTRRSEALLAAEAISAYVEYELRIVENIKKSLGEVAAGHVVPHEEAMAEIDAGIMAAERDRM